jgi:hypothetical protein
MGWSAQHDDRSGRKSMDPALETYGLGARHPGEAPAAGNATRSVAATLNLTPTPGYGHRESTSTP